LTVLICTSAFILTIGENNQYFEKLRVNNFLIQNIIYDVKFLTKSAERERYEDVFHTLNEEYPWPSGEEKTIAVVTPSVGAEIIVEFSEISFRAWREHWRTISGF
jgi:hypothetical protein